MLSVDNEIQSSTFSVTQVCEQLIEIEQEQDLFNLSIQGVYVWQLFRMPVYYELTRKLGIFGAPHGTSQWQGRRWQRGR